MNVGEMIVRFAADVQNFTRGAQQVTESVNQIHQQAEVHMRGFTSAIHGALSSLLEFGANAYLAFQGVTEGMGLLGHAFDIFKEGFTVDQSFQNLQAQLTAITGSSGSAQKIIDWVKQFGQQVPDTTEHLAEAVVTIQSLGINAESVMPSLANIAAAMGVDLPTAAQAFADAFEGRFQMLQMTLHVSKEELVKYGLNLNNIQGTLATALANFQKAKLPDGLKEGMSTLQGQLSNLTDRFQFFAGKLAQPIFNLAQQGLQAFFGFLDDHQQIINTIATDVGQGLASALQWLGQQAGQVAGLLSQIPFGAIAQDIGGLVGQISSFVGSLDLGDKIKQAFSGLGNIGKGIDLSSLLKTLQPLGGLFSSLASDGQKLVRILVDEGWKSFQQTLSDWGPIISQLGGWFQSQMLPALMQLVPPIENLVNVIVTRGVPAFFTIRNEASHLVSVLASTFLPIFERVEPIVVKLAGYLLDLGQKALAFLIPKIQQAAQTVGDFAAGIATRLQPFIDHLSQGIQVAADIIQKVWGFLWPWVSAVLKFAWDNVTGILNIGWQFISGLFNIFADLLSGNWSQLWKDIQSTVGNIFGAVKSFVGNIWGDLKHLWDVGTGYIKNVWNDLWDGLASIAGKAWDGVKGVIRNGINGAIDLLNKLIDAADHVPGVNISHIPYVSFAAGGVMAQTGLALVGERGPEMMMLPGGARIFNNEFVQQFAALAQGLGGSNFTPQSGISSYAAVSAGGTVVVEHHTHVHLGGRELAHVVDALGPVITAKLRNAGIRV